MYPHGSGSQDGTKWGDPEHDGVLNACHYNGDQTNMTRVGFFKVAGIIGQESLQELARAQAWWFTEAQWCANGWFVSNKSSSARKW